MSEALNTRRGEDAPHPIGVGTSVEELEKGLQISVVIPTRDESGNIRPLLDRLLPALAERRSEVIFVDDSSDDTPEVIEGSAGRWPGLHVRCIHRSPGERKGGLGGAVVAGLREAGAPVAVIMDGDLQHPPEVIPALVEKVERGVADLVVGSRYTAGGESSGLSGRTREAVSRLSTLLSRAVFGRRLKGVSDPMSGFFALRLASLDLDSLRPMGFKILLEILARSDLSASEVGILFARRNAGVSKAGFGEGVKFLEQLAKLRLVTLLSARKRRALGFAAVGVAGIGVNSAAFWAMNGPARMNVLVAAALSTQVSTSANFAGVEYFVFKEPRHHRMWKRYLGFSAVNNAVMLGRLPFLALLTGIVGVPGLLSNLITLVASFAIRFLVSDRVIYGEGGGMSVAEMGDTKRVGPVLVSQSQPGEGRSERTAPRGAGRDWPYRYDVHGVLRIGSEVELPELAYFCLGEVIGNPGRFSEDLAISVSGFGGFHNRARLYRSSGLGSIRWEEQVGPLAANFSIEMSRPMKVVASPTLARSPHVLYTNVVEPLLRFALVEKGYMLLHSASIKLNGAGVMLSARTDTGKTGTVLRLLGLPGSRFLSDDMSIVDETGTVLSYPKPLTISDHTLRAVDAGRLSRREWAWLRVQSKVHSKEGRAFAMRLAEHNLPIMTINAWAQRILPPPKYDVYRLVKCTTAKAVSVSEVFIIERGIAHHSLVPLAQAVDEMLANTEDAYGFPPYRYIAPWLSINGQNAQALLRKERGILESAMTGVLIHRLGSPDFSWAKDISDITMGREWRISFPGSSSSFLADSEP